MSYQDPGPDGATGTPRGTSVEQLLPFWAQFRRLRDPLGREELLVAYQFIVDDMLDELAEHTLGEFDLAALERRAVRSLGDAVDRYPDNGEIERFPNYAATRVRAAVTDGLHQMDWLPRAIVRHQPPSAPAASRPAGIEAPASAGEAALQGLAWAGTDQVALGRGAGRGAHPAGTGRTSRLDDERAPFRALARMVSVHRIDLPARNEDDAADQVRRAMRRLPEQQRTVLTLQFLAGLSLEQIGALLGTSLIGTRRAIELGLSTLRIAIEDDAGPLAAQAG
jgi:RNA polymerase sigma factor (sigma-70 family)